MGERAFRGDWGSYKKVRVKPHVPQHLTGDHQMGFCHTEDVMNSPCRQHLSHRLINHFGSVVCFNCHRSQKPNYKHLLQKRICKRAFSAQDHTHVLPADLYPAPGLLVWAQLPDLRTGLLSMEGFPPKSLNTLLLQAPGTLPKLESPSCCLRFVCLELLPYTRKALLFLHL